MSELAQRRRRVADDLTETLAQLEGLEPDSAALQTLAQQRQSGSQAAMMNALAAGYAGDQFANLQRSLLSRSSDLGGELKIGDAVLSNGGVVVDPYSAQRRKVATAQRRADLAGQSADAAEMHDQRAFDAAQLQMQRLEEQARQDALARSERATLLKTLASLRYGGEGGRGKAPTGYQWTTTADGQAALTFIPGGPADPSNKAASAPTEDERKAAGWYWQADLARRNIDQVMKETPGAAYPTVAESMAAKVPLVGDAFANSLRPESRQKFVQAASSMSEALLRAATGAGVNESEARQKAAELTPQLGDKPGTVQQKLGAYDMYMNALRARAGRALPQTPAGNAAPAVNDLAAAARAEMERRKAAKQ